jgi:hypothetical protein
MVTTFVPGRDMVAVRKRGYGRSVGGVVPTVFCERGESHMTNLHVVRRTEIQSKDIATHVFGESFAGTAREK